VPNGVLILHVPHINQKRYFKKFKIWKQSNHVRNGYSQEEIMYKLNAAGFNNVKTEFTCGYLGALSWEIQKYLEHFFSHRIGQIISFPFTVLLGFIDTHLTKISGNGILLVSKK